MAKVIVIYGGGFQPFHAGHLSSYLEAKRAFPKADFYVAASNDTKTRPIPFKDKKFLAQQAGVASPFVEVKLPIRPLEILDKYNPETDIFILVRSERDPVAYTKKDGTPGYYQPFVSLDECNPFVSNGYIFVTKKHDFILNGHEVYSGTQVRDMYADSDDSGRMQMIDQMYPKSKQKNTIKKMLDTYLGTKAEPVIAKPVKGAVKKLKDKQLAENLSNLIRKARPLLKESTTEQKVKLLRLMKEAYKHALKENTDMSINDDWFKQGSFNTYKKPAIEKYEIAKYPGTVDTLEGQIHFDAGNYIMTGPKGERYPISPEKFKNLKDDLGHGKCKPKKISKIAKLADHDGSVVLQYNGQKLNYTAGNDYIVQHGPGDYGVVKKDIFAQTYALPNNVTENSPVSADYLSEK